MRDKHILVMQHQSRPYLGRSKLQPLHIRRSFLRGLFFLLLLLPLPRAGYLFPLIILLLLLRLKSAFFFEEISISVVFNFGSARETNASRRRFKINAKTLNSLREGHNNRRVHTLLNILRSAANRIIKVHTSHSIHKTEEEPI